jgi:hypothetical protein
MSRRHTGIGVAALALAAALPAIVGATTAAYTTPTLKVTVSGSNAVISASGSATDDSTARVAIYAPAGATLAAAAPGSTIGSVKAELVVLGLGGALVPLTGTVTVPAAGTPPPSSQAACTQNQTPTASWRFNWDPVVGQQLPAVPLYVLPTTGAETALGALKFVVCLPPPDVPEANGGAPLGAKFIGVEATLRGAITAPATGTWIALWTPYQAATGQVNTAGTVASPAVSAPGSLAVAARRREQNVAVSGTVTQGGQPVAGAAVRLQRGRTAGRLGAFRTLRTNSQGKFAITTVARAGTFFRASTTVPGRTSAAVCASLGSALPVPCVNGTISGFAATTRTVRAR